MFRVPRAHLCVVVGAVCKLCLWTRSALLLLFTPRADCGHMVYVGRSCTMVPPLHEVPWTRPLPAPLESAVPLIADPHLACFASKLRNTLPVKIVFFGSSVTAGIRCRHNKERSVNFPQQLLQLLAHRFPQSNISADVYGYPGASPSFMTACHHSLMRTDGADLYVIEMTDNLSDGYDGVGKSIEQLLSQIRQRAPTAAFMLLAPIPQRCVRSIKRMKPFQHIPRDDFSTRMLLAHNCFGNRSVAASFEDVGRAHQISTVSARFLIHDELFRQPSDAGRIVGKLHYDAVHPSGAGHWYLATALEAAITRVAASALCEHPKPDELESRNVFMPRTIGPGGSVTRLVCATGDELKQFVLRSSGWRYTVERNSQGLPKPGYIAETPGATMDLCHRPELRLEQQERTHRVLNVQVAWSLGYLMSYEHMGQMRGECLRSEGSCSCGTRIFNAHWRLPISQPHVSRLKLQIRYARRTPGEPLVPLHTLRDPASNDGTAAATCPCVIRFTLLNQTDSREHKFKLVSLMNGFYTGTIVSDAVGWAARYDLM